MPSAVTPKLAEQAARIYQLRHTHRDSGQLLAGWDTASRDIGLCDGQIAQASLRGDEGLICCVEGPPATVYVLTVTRLSPLSGAVATSIAPPQVRFELLGGAGRAASQILVVDWTPNDWLTGAMQSFIFQATPRLCQSWWLFGRVSFAQGPAIECQIDVRLLLERATPTAITPQVGPGVVVVP
jgi:hypothetical protein